MLIRMDTRGILQPCHLYTLDGGELLQDPVVDTLLLSLCHPCSALIPIVWLQQVALPPYLFPVDDPPAFHFGRGHTVGHCLDVYVDGAIPFPAQPARVHRPVRYMQLVEDIPQW